MCSDEAAFRVLEQHEKTGTMDPFGNMLDDDQCRQTAPEVRLRADYLSS